MILDERFAHLVNLEAGRLGRCGRIPFAGGDHAEIDDRPIACGKLAGQLAIGIDFVCQIDDLRFPNQSCGVIRLDGIRKDIGLPGGTRIGMHPAHLFLDNLGHLRLGGKFHRSVGQPTGLKFELLRRHLLEAEGFNAVRQEVGSGIPAAGLDVSHQIALAIAQGEQLGAENALDDQRPRLERGGVAEIHGVVARPFGG